MCFGFSGQLKDLNKLVLDPEPSGFLQAQGDQ